MVGRRSGLLLGFGLFSGAMSAMLVSGRVTIDSFPTGRAQCFGPTDGGVVLGMVPLR